MKDTRRGWKSWNAIVVGFVAVTLGGFFNKGWSEDLPPPTAGTPTTAAAPTTTVDQRIDQLDQQIKSIQQEIQTNAKSPTTPPAPAPSQNAPAGERTAARPGFAFQSEDGDFILRLQGLIQADGRFYTGSGDTNKSYTSAVNTSGQTPTVSQFLLRRVRPIFSGTVYHNFDFFLQPDFGGNTAAIYDAYVDARPKTYFNVRIGKFKTPLGLERLQTDSYLTFAERALTADLIPQRDTGLQLYGGFFGNALTYQASLTNGIADGAFTPDSDTNNSKDGTVRLFAQPFKNTNTVPLKGLGVGIAGSYTGDITTIPTYKTAAGQEQFFSYAAATTFNGQRTHLVPQANYYLGSLGVYAEYAETNQVAQTGRIRKNLSDDAWQGAASYVLTGENATYTGVVPNKPFNLEAGTWGAFEAAARIQQLQVDPNTFQYGFASLATSASRATAYTIGLNWYLNRYVKLVTDYEETWFKNGNGATGNRPTELLIDTRWQLAF